MPHIARHCTGSGKSAAVRTGGDADTGGGPAAAAGVPAWPTPACANVSHEPPAELDALGFVGVGRGFTGGVVAGAAGVLAGVLVPGFSTSPMFAKMAASSPFTGICPIHLPKPAHVNSSPRARRSASGASPSAAGLGRVVAI